MTVRTGISIKEIISNSRRIGLYSSVIAVFLGCCQWLVFAAPFSDVTEIKWLRAGWRGEQMRVADGTGSDGATQNFFEDFPWLKVALGNAIELSDQVRISPDGYAYFFESKQTTGQDPVTNVYRVFPGMREPEKFASGLRQPLPIVFDAFGHGFVLDAGLEDSAGGRWLHLIQGVDYGWRNVDNAEGWRGVGLSVGGHKWPANPVSSLKYTMPPLSELEFRPVSVTAATDTGWSPDSPQVFFVVGKKDKDYQLESFLSRSSGAGYELSFDVALARSKMPMSLAQGAESGVILTQSVEEGIEPSRQISFRFFDLKYEHTPDTLRTKQMLGTHPHSQSTSILIQWLDHPDLRIRMKAQFALAGRGETVLGAILQRVKNPFQTIGRLHALWTIRLIVSQEPELRLKLSKEAWETSLLSDPVPSVRSLALEIYATMDGDLREVFVNEALDDVDPGVRLQAVQLLGTLGMKISRQRLLDWIVRDENQQYALQHAAMAVLSDLMNAEDLAELATHPSDKVRMAALLGLRRKAHVGIHVFLHDANPFISLEAARAIMQEPVTGALPPLANLHATRSAWSPAFVLMDQHTSEESLLGSMLRCVYAANVALQQPNHIRALAEAAEALNVEEETREYCSALLLHWLRDEAQGNGSWDDTFDAIWKDRVEDWSRADLDIQHQFILEFIRFREWKHHAPLVERIFRGYGETHENRAMALWILAGWRVPHLQTIIRDALISNSALLRKEAVLIQLEINPEDQVAAWVRQLESGEFSDWQAALKQLGSSRDRRVDSVLLYWLDEALNGNLSMKWQGDLMEAAQRRTPPVIRQKLADLKDKYEK